LRPAAAARRGLKWFYSLNTFVGGTCSLPSALLVNFTCYSCIPVAVLSSVPLCRYVGDGCTDRREILHDVRLNMETGSIESTNVTDEQTHRRTPHDGTGRACIASRGKNSEDR